MYLFVYSFFLFIEEGSVGERNFFFINLFIFIFCFLFIEEGIVEEGNFFLFIYSFLLLLLLFFCLLRNVVLGKGTHTGLYFEL